MKKEIIMQWESNKSALEEYFKTTPQSEYSEYKTIVTKLIELVIKDQDEYNKWDYANITEIDNGDYQGTKIYLIPSDTYQPSETDYLVTANYYGSCSGCDTLQGISGYDDELPTEDQVKEYMTLALHLVQRMKPLYGDEK